MAFGPIMEFTTESGLKIQLAPPTKEAMSAFVDIAHGGGIQRSSITRYMGLDNAPVEEDELAWFEKTRQEKSSLTWGIWIVAPEGEEIEGQSRLLIGNTTLFGIDMEGHTRLIRQASSGSMIFRPEYHGKGIASAAHKARTWFAFTQHGLHRIKSAVIQANGASLTALKKSGYTLVYTERNEQFSDGKFHHLDCLENLNPLPMFWRQWWNQDRPSRAALEARDLTRSALEWASQNVKLL